MQMTNNHQISVGKFLAHYVKQIFCRPHFSISPFLRKKFCLVVTWICNMVTEHPNNTKILYIHITPSQYAIYNITIS